MIVFTELNAWMYQGKQQGICSVVGVGLLKFC